MPKPRRGTTALSGVVLVDKPATWTSHDVVGKLRALTGEGRIGHAGTLDPAATGVLVMLIGPATRLSQDLTAGDKRYTATIAFGTQTTTDDAEGAVLATSDPALTLFDFATAQALLDTFTGPQRQIPPQFAAIKQSGTAAYKQARAGKTVSFKPRAIEVFEARLITADAATAIWTVDFTVSKGTYIRALARDIGRAGGTYAHLSDLRRTAAGPFTLDGAHTITDLEECVHTDPFAIADYFVPTETLAQALPNGQVPPFVFGPRIPACALAIGTFDGVHRGHQDLLRSVVHIAQEQGLRSAALTFDPPPSAVVRPRQAATPLMDVPQKIAAIKACGIDDVVIVPFTPALAQRAPASFIEDVLFTHADARVVCVGENFRFGAHGAGTPATMDALLHPKGVTVTVRPLLRDESGAVISSTRIRALLAAGDTAGARGLLGR